MHTTLHLALLSFCAPSDRLAYGPAEGTRVRVAFHQETGLELVESSMVLTVGGEEQHAATPFEALSSHEELALVFAEVTGAVEEGRPARIARSFEEVRLEKRQTVKPAGGESVEELDRPDSALEGETVVFTWDGEDEAYEAALEEKGGDEALLEGLEARADLAWMLPDGEVAQGASWELDPRLFRRILQPVGEIAYGKDGSAGTAHLDEALERLEGSFRVEHRGTRELEGKTAAVLALTLELETWSEREEVLPGLQDGRRTMRVELAYELEGEACWLVEERRARSLELEGESSVRMRRVDESDSPMGAAVLALQQELEGSYRLRMDFE